MISLIKKMQKYKLKIIYIFSLLYLIICHSSCVQTPNTPENEDLSVPSEAAYILCEGLWYMDNSSLSRYDIESSTVINNYFSKVNPNLRIGDLANDLVIKGDSGFIAVTTAKTIEAMNLKTGKSIGRIVIEGNSVPRKICIINDTLAAFTELYENKVKFFNPRTIELLNLEIELGPAPEGIVSDGKHLFVANSGYGDYLSHLPKAGTVSVIDLISMKEIHIIESGKNTVALFFNRGLNKIFAIYNNLPSLADSLGGIVMINPNNFLIEKEWKTVARSLCFSDDGKIGYFIDNNGVSKIQCDGSNSEIELVINNANSKDVWYSLAYYSKGNSLWLGNARNYQINGEVIIYDLDNLAQAVKRFDVGINPNTIVFY